LNPAPASALTTASIVKDPAALKVHRPVGQWDNLELNPNLFPLWEKEHPRRH
jgi:hypothetical protein